VSDEISFQFQIPELPKGEALTGEEVERLLLDRLEAAGDDCLMEMWELICFYTMSWAKTEKVEHYIRRFLDLAEDPENKGAAMLALGQYAERRGDFPTAVRHYQTAVSLEPCSTFLWYFIHNNLGYSLNQIGEHEKAVACLKAALKIDPTRANAYKNLALALQALGELQDAARLFVAATQVDASDGRSLDHLEELVESHPELLVDLPGLGEQLEACRKAVLTARSLQPDMLAHWQKMRESQESGEEAD
jgi:tetratricopeptide (TPR) repeat protein